MEPSTPPADFPRRDKREKIMEDFHFFFDRVSKLPGEDTEVSDQDIPHIIATAASLVVANETRKLETVAYHGIRDLLNIMSSGTQKM